MKFDSMLEYQKIDSELVKIERELNNSTEKEKASALNAKIKTAGDNMAKFQSEADELNLNAEKLAANVGKYKSEVKEIADSIRRSGRTGNRILRKGSCGAFRRRQQTAEGTAKSVRPYRSGERQQRQSYPSGGATQRAIQSRAAKLSRLETQIAKRRSPRDGKTESG